MGGMNAADSRKRGVETLCGGGAKRRIRQIETSRGQRPIPGAEDRAKHERIGRKRNRPLGRGIEGRGQRPIPGAEDRAKHERTGRKRNRPLGGRRDRCLHGTERESVPRATRQRRHGSGTNAEYRTTNATTYTHRPTKTTGILRATNGAARIWAAFRRCGSTLSSRRCCIRYPP